MTSLTADLRGKMKALDWAWTKPDGPAAPKTN